MNSHKNCGSFLNYFTKTRRQKYHGTYIAGTIVAAEHAQGWSSRGMADFFCQVTVTSRTRLHLGGLRVMPRQATINCSRFHSTHSPVSNNRFGISFWGSGSCLPNGIFLCKRLAVGGGGGGASIKTGTGNSARNSLACAVFRFSLWTVAPPSGEEVTLQCAYCAMLQRVVERDVIMSKFNKYCKSNKFCN